MSYKKRLFLKPEFESPGNERLFHQLSHEVRRGSLLILVPMLVALVALSVQAYMPKPLLKTEEELSSRGLMFHVPGPWYYAYSEAVFAQKVLADLKTRKLDEPAPKVQHNFISHCQQSPFYGHTLFYCFREDNKKDFVVSLNHSALNFLDDNYQIKSSLPLSSIASFGCAPLYLWMKVVDLSKPIVNGMPELKLIRLFTFQLYSMIHDYTHPKPLNASSKKKSTRISSIRGAMKRMSLKPNRCPRSSSL